MKKLISAISIFAVVALLLCSLSLTVLAEQDEAQNDVSISEKAEDTDDNQEPIITIGAIEDDADDSDSEPVITVGASEDSDDSQEPVLTIGATEETTGATATEDSSSGVELEPIQFVLIKKLAKLVDGEHTKDLIMLIVSLVLFAALAVVIICTGKSKNEKFETKASPVKLLVTGAMCLSLAFVLSYIKLFSMPFGGSITLCSMLPIMIYAAWAGPKYGFLVAFAYAVLQFVQGTYPGIHWGSIIMDYGFAFTALGLTSLFRNEKMLPIGILCAGFARMIFSCISGYILFASYAPEGMNPLLYTVIYNFMTIGIDTIICFVVYVIPPVRKMFGKAREMLIA